MLASVGCGQSGDKQAAVKVEDAKKLNFTYKTTDGETVDARQFFGKVVIVDIWTPGAARAASVFRILWNSMISTKVKSKSSDWRSDA